MVDPHALGPRIALVLAVLTGAASAEPPADPYLVEPLAEGVTLFRPREPAAGRANTLVVEQQHRLVVIDAQPSPAAARELLALIGRHFDKPVGMLLLSHAHAEAAGGASAFGDPTIIVASQRSAEALADDGHDFGAEVRVLATEWTAPPVPEPDMAITGLIRISDPVCPLLVYPVGAAHTHGDLLVYLPEQNLMYVGGILSPERNPYADGKVSGWISRLSDLVRRSPSTVVAVRGPATDSEAVRQQRNALSWLINTVADVFADGNTDAEAVRAAVLSNAELGRRFAVDATPSFVPRLVDAVIHENLEHYYRRGILERP